VLRDLIPEFGKRGGEGKRGDELGEHRNVWKKKDPSTKGKHIYLKREVKKKKAFCLDTERLTIGENISIREGGRRLK